jgi:hypothetical protein
MCLVLLNKAWPDIPKIDQFKPILFLSPLFKLTERRIQWQLSLYMTQCLDRNQTGFITRIGTNVNLLLLVERLRNTIKREG